MQSWGGYDEPLNLKRRCYIADKIKPEDNVSNMQNPNPDTRGINAQFKAAQDNRANQLNPNNPAYWKSRGIELEHKDKADK